MYEINGEHLTSLHCLKSATSYDFSGTGPATHIQANTGFYEKGKWTGKSCDAVIPIKEFFKLVHKFGVIKQEELRI